MPSLKGLRDAELVSDGLTLLVALADGVTLELAVPEPDSVAEGVDVPELVPVSEEEALPVHDEDAETLALALPVDDTLPDAEAEDVEVSLADGVCVPEFVRVAVDVPLPLAVCNGRWSHGGGVAGGVDQAGTGLHSRAGAANPPKRRQASGQTRCYKQAPLVARSLAVLAHHAAQ